MVRRFVLALLAGLVSSCDWASSVQEPPIAPMDLSRLALKELMNIEVTLVSGKSERVSERSTAGFVLPSEDIRLSGATSGAEVLRIAPGSRIARIDANKSAITSRGFRGDSLTGYRC